eukprot:617835-Rhodomonas_salina.4
MQLSISDSSSQRRMLTDAVGAEEEDVWRHLPEHTEHTPSARVHSVRQTCTLARRKVQPSHLLVGRRLVQPRAPFLSADKVGSNRGLLDPLG